MAGETTLIVTTRSGVRPLGVRGEPLHNAAPQLRRVVRRRLGDAAADLLAEPQLHEDGKAIDWYADWAGPVRPLSALRARAPGGGAGRDRARPGRHPPPGRCSGRRPGPREDMRRGRPVAAARRLRARGVLHLHGGRAAGDRVLGLREGSGRRACCPTGPAARSRNGARCSDVPPPSRAVPAVRPPGAVIPWARTLLLALPLLLLLLGGAWLLRELLAGRARPGARDPRGTARATARPSPPPDPMPALKAAFSTEQSRGSVLKVELSLIEAELKKRIADCKPPEPPKPPPQGGRRAAARSRRPAPRPLPPPQPQRRSQRQSPAPALGTDQRLFLHGGLLAHRSVPPRDAAAAAGRVVLLLRRQRQRPARMAARPHRLPHARTGALRRRRSCACAMATRPATTARTGMPTSSSAAAAPTTWRNAAARSRGAFGPVSWTVNLHKLN